MLGLEGKQSEEEFHFGLSFVRFSFIATFIDELDVKLTRVLCLIHVSFHA